MDLLSPIVTSAQSPNRLVAVQPHRLCRGACQAAAGPRMYVAPPRMKCLSVILLSACVNKSYVKEIRQRVPRSRSW